MPTLRNEVPVSPDAPFSRLIRASASVTPTLSAATSAPASAPTTLVRNAVPLPAGAPVSRPLPGTRPGW